MIFYAVKGWSTFGPSAESLMPRQDILRYMGYGKVYMLSRIIIKIAIEDISYVDVKGSIPLWKQSLKVLAYRNIRAQSSAQLTILRVPNSKRYDGSA